ncbi:PaaX family transcriptional regulator C-terminal domain-containing protein [Halanaerobium sp. ST460_2HS_T2]|uniref:PaaX family transcriptional regulator C-terminal domain-containing protein n=1 Tax=Halanaerobium sp. ST460_2HS_T2 TaxID=2183914 RepID=UPI000E034FCA|nr:PaaX family transcriptional regulator C-terminal domain-containing protein [Halanaerobium sp. ST460_2HS_T2]RCW52112.1 PaaX family transcriptional regulator [Halanaerobium sp. ST460_2HS_T2]
MAVNIRNRDSVTGIVLFIFNLLQEYKDMSAEIEQRDLIRYLESFGKSESSIRMGLSRMSRSKVIKKIKSNSKIYYSLDKDGKEYIDIWRRGLKYFQLKYQKRQGNSWNFDWDCYIFKGFRKTNPQNSDLVEIMGEIGYAEIESNVWISAYKMGSELDPIFNDREISYLNLNTQVNGQIDIADFLKEEFKLGKLKEEYTELISMVKANNEQIKKKKLKTEELLPLLGYTGWKFYSIITKDPFLPEQLLDNWVGDRAVKIFIEFRKSLFTEITNDLFNKDHNIKG